MVDREGSEFQPLTNDNLDALSDFLDHAEGVATAHIKKKIKDIPKVVLPINRVPESSLLFDSNDLIPPPKGVEKELEKEKEDGGNVDSDVKGDVKGKKKKKLSHEKSKKVGFQPLSRRRFVKKKITQKVPVKKGSVIASSDLDPEQKNKKYDVEDNVLMHPERNYIDKVPDLKSTNYKDIDTRLKLRQQHIQDLIDKKGSIT